MEMQQLLKLRQSQLHNELGRNLCAAYIAHQQGTSIPTALKKLPSTPIGDAWLFIADFTIEIINNTPKAKLGNGASTFSGVK